MTNNKEDLYQIILDQQERNITAFEGVQNALNNINDFNVLHASKEDLNYEAIKNLTTSNKAIVDILKWTVVTIVSALIILAGAEKALMFIKTLQL